MVGEPELSTMVEPEPSGLGGCANGVAIGTLLWNGIFLGLSGLGVLPGEVAWVGIKATYALAGFWFVAILGLGARR